MRLRYLLTVFCLCLSCGCAACDEREYVRLTPELAAENNFYQVSDGLYRASQPDACMMRLYEEQGIKTVINLRAFHSDADKVEGTSLKLVEVPVLTWDLSMDEVVTVLQAVRDAEKPVLVHCQHGADRTGMMVAMYRIVEQGWSKERAIAEMREGGFGFHSIWFHIDDFIMQADAEAVRNALR